MTLNDLKHMSFEQLVAVCLTDPAHIRHAQQPARLPKPAETLPAWYTQREAEEQENRWIMFGGS